MKHVGLLLVVCWAGSWKLFAQVVVPEPQTLDTSQSSQPVQLQLDTATVQLRQPSTAQLEAFQADRDFRYDRPPPKNPGWFEAFLNNFRLDPPDFDDPEWDSPDPPDLDPPAVSGWGRFWQVLIYVVLAGLVAGLLYQLGFFTLVFGDRAKADLNFTEHAEDPNQIDYERRLNEARVNHDWRMLIRLLYLRFLYRLQNNGRIVWKPEKTNRDYVNEIADPELRQRFEQAALIFDYVWYGDFPAEPPLVAEIERLSQIHTTTPTA